MFFLKNIIYFLMLKINLQDLRRKKGYMVKFSFPDCKISQSK